MTDSEAWLDSWPPELVFAIGAWPRRQQRASRQARARLLDTLTEHGITADDYRLIEWARAIVHIVNGRLAERGSPTVYALGLHVASEPVHPPERLEDRPGGVAADEPPGQPAGAALRSLDVADVPLGEVQRAAEPLKA